MAGSSPRDRRGRGCGAWCGSAWRQDAGLDGQQTAPARSDLCRQGGIGGRGRQSARSSGRERAGRLIRNALAGPAVARRGRRPAGSGQRNFTDPDSRILPTRDGFVQGYNGQIAVDAAYQVIVAHRLVTNSADHRALVPLVDDVRAHLGRKPREVSGDAGFANEANLAALKKRRITAYLAPGRAGHVMAGRMRPGAAG